MELRRTKLIQELREAREELLNINFDKDISRYYYRAPVIDRTVSLGYVNISNRYGLVLDWFHKWRAAYRRFYALNLTDDNVDIEAAIHRRIKGYEREEDVELFNELRSDFVSLIDFALSKLDQEYQVKPLLE